MLKVTNVKGGHVLLKARRGVWEDLKGREEREK